jgi:intergrase/recombinase
MLPPTRTANKFCKRGEFKTFASAASQGDRYWGINATAFNRHKTIEIRMHSATTDYTKIINWIDILLGVANCEDKVEHAPRNLTAFLREYHIQNEVLAKYMRERINQFKDMPTATQEDVGERRTMDE